MEMTMATAGHVSNDILPGDIMLDIFLRLRVKTLKRLSCVCKSWYSTFQNPNFIMTYNKSVNRDIELLLCVEYHFQIYTNNPFNHLRISLFSDKTMQPIKLPLQSFFSGNDPPIICGCKGLICISHKHDLSLVALLNPSTREFQPLPPFDRVQPNGRNYIAVEATGLGYDSINNDYKIIRFLIHSENEDYYDYTQWVELYSLSTNSWKEIPCTWTKNQTIRHNNSSTYFNGCCHWLAMEDEEEEEELKSEYILAFDMHQETFQTMKLPHCFSYMRDGDFCIPTTLRLFNNNLAVSPSSMNMNDCFEIWVMRDYGNSNSWVKQIVIGSILANCKLQDMWTDGKWFVSTDDGKFRSYDQSKDVVKDLVKFGESCTNILEQKFFSTRENLLPLNAR